MSVANLASKDGNSSSASIDNLSQYKFLLITAKGQDGGCYSAPAGFIDLRGVTTSTSVDIRGGQTSYTQSNNYWTRTITANVSSSVISFAAASNNYGVGTNRAGYVDVMGIK